MAGKIQGGASAVAYTTTAADYAEYFLDGNLSERVADGYIAALSTSVSSAVVRATPGSVPIGVGSATPGFIGNGPICAIDDEQCDSRYGETNALIGLNGQINTWVTTENGAIQPGDPITLSTTIPGVGMKATTSAYVVGYAMESFSGDGMGKIRIYVNPGLYQPNPNDPLQGLNYLKNGDTASFASLNVTGPTTLTSLSVTGDADIQGALTVQGDTTVVNLYVGGKLVSRGAVPVTALGAALNGVLGASISNSGTDTAGTVSIVSGSTAAQTGVLAEITFTGAYTTPPKIVISGNNAKSAKLGAYVVRTSTGFQIVTDDVIEQGTTYEFDYIIIETQTPQ